MKNTVLLTGIVTELPASIGDSGVRVTLAGITPPRSEGAKGRSFYHEANLWGGLASSVLGALQPGVPVMIQGELRQREYTTSDGNRREQVGINVRNVRFLDADGLEVALDAREQARLVNAFNTTELQGNLVSEPRLSETPKGLAVANARIAVNDQYTNRDGEIVKTTQFVNLTFWGPDAVAISGASKGQGIYVEGSFDQDDYADKDGNKRYTQFITVSRYALLARSIEDAAPVGAGSEYTPAPSDTVPEETLPF